MENSWKQELVPSGEKEGTRRVNRSLIGPREEEEVVPRVGHTGKQRSESISNISRTFIRVATDRALSKFLVYIFDVGPIEAPEMYSKLVCGREQLSQRCVVTALLLSLASERHKCFQDVGRNSHARGHRCVRLRPGRRFHGERRSVRSFDWRQSRTVRARTFLFFHSARAGGLYKGAARRAVAAR